MKKILTVQKSNPLSTLTVRNIPLDVDQAIIEQASLSKMSKSDFIQSLLTDIFGDLIGNFVRTSPLVKLIDEEVEKLTGARLNDTFFCWHSPVENRHYGKILGITDQEQLKQIMMAGMAPELLSVRAKQYGKADYVPHGISLYFALFAEAARRDDLQLLLTLHRTLFFGLNETLFLEQIDEMRQAMRLPPTERPDF